MDWISLQQQCDSCRKCPLADTRTNVVFGTGVQNAEVMLIGEGPGEQEDLQGVPFVGRAGQLLDDMLEIIDLSRSTNVYIANIVKCRPPGNRVPLPEEQEACKGFLREQIRIVQPWIIVALGATAAQTLVSPALRITRDRGKWQQKGRFWILPTYHPAALLRDESKKRDAWTDFQAVKQLYTQLLADADGQR